MKVVVDLGTTPAGAGVTARNAIDSAFNNSSLPGAGWTLSHVDGAAIAGFLATLSPTTTGILYIPTAGHAVGDLLAAELAAINAAAAQINSYVSGTGDPTQGGALFAMGETQLGATPEFGWLSALLPGVKVMFMSAYDRDFLVARGLTPSGPVITKPFTVEYLARRVQMVLGDRARAASAPSPAPSR